MDAFDLYPGGTWFEAWPEHGQVFHGFTPSLLEIFRTSPQIKPHPLPHPFQLIVRHRYCMVGATGSVLTRVTRVKLSYYIVSNSRIGLPVFHERRMMDGRSPTLFCKLSRGVGGILVQNVM
jgi:hypothetical protein